MIEVTFQLVGAGFAEPAGLGVVKVARGVHAVGVELAHAGRDRGYRLVVSCWYHVGCWK